MTESMKILCAGCYDWFTVRDLKVSNGHPYCVHCFPAVRVVRHGGAEHTVMSDAMKKRPAR